MLNFNFSEKGLGLVSASHFANDFSRKMILMLHSINWPNLIVWLPLLLQILGNMCITIVCYPGCDIIKFEINRIFLIKSFCYMTKKSRQKLKYLENKKSFWSEIKSIFHHFQGLWVAKNCFRPESVPLNNYEKRFLFHLKTSFHSRDIQIFVFPTSPKIFPVSHWLRGWFKINNKVYDVIIYLNKNLIKNLV